MPSPRVSVVVPTRGRPGFLRRAVGSVLAQTFPDVEVVVVDDGPSPEVAAFVAGHADERVRLIRHETNRGVATARNTGVAAARGEYLAFLDDDDVWLPHKLERQLAAAGAGARVVHSLVYVADAEGRVYERASERGFRLFREVAAAGCPYVWLLRRSACQIGTFLVHRDCVAEVGGFDPELPTVEDLDFVHRLRRRFPFHLVDEPLSKYCRHDGNASSRTDPEVWVRLASKELAWLESADPPGRREIEAYLWMQVAQARWIGRRYRAAPRPALRARRLDATVIATGTLAKYLAAAALPSALADALRREARGRRAPAEPDPWLDLPTPLPAGLGRPHRRRLLRLRRPQPSEQPIDLGTGDVERRVGRILAQAGDPALEPAAVDRLDHAAVAVDADLERVGVAAPPVDEAVERGQVAVAGERRRVEPSDAGEGRLHGAGLGVDVPPLLPAAERHERGQDDGAGGDGGATTA